MYTGDEKLLLRFTHAVATGLLGLTLAGCEQKLSIADDAATVCVPLQPIIAVFNLRDHDLPVADYNATARSSDIALLLEVKSALDREPGLKRFPLDVGVRGGVITLYGEVDTTERRAHAVQIAQNVQGVRAVKTGIAVVRRL